MRLPQVLSTCNAEGGDEPEGRLFIRSGLADRECGPDVYEGRVNPKPAEDGSVDKTTHYDLYGQARDDLLASEDAADVAKAQQYYTFSPTTSLTEAILQAKSSYWEASCPLSAPTFI